MITKTNKIGQTTKKKMTRMKILQNPRDWRYANSYPKDQIIGDPTQGVRTRSTLRNLDNYLAFVSQIEPKSIEEAECDSDWMVAIQEELNQFERNKV